MCMLSNFPWYVSRWKRKDSFWQKKNPMCNVGVWSTGQSYSRQNNTTNNYCQGYLHAEIDLFSSKKLLRKAKFHHKNMRKWPARGWWHRGGPVPPADTHWCSVWAAGRAASDRLLLSPCKSKKHKKLHSENTFRAQLIKTSAHITLCCCHYNETGQTANHLAQPVA